MRNPVQITRAERRILDALAVVRFATNDQLCSLLYAPASIFFVRKVTHRLVKRRLLVANPQWTTSMGPSRMIFTLSESAQKLYPQLPSINHYRGKNEAMRALTQPHILGLTDLAILFHKFAKAHPDVTILEYIHDQILTKRPLYATLEGKAVRVVPDAWVALSIRGHNRFVWVELDRNTEDEGRWRKKIKDIVHVPIQTIAEQFGTDRFTIMVAVDEPGQLGVNRANRLLHWTEKELVACGKEAWSPVFLVSPAEFRLYDPTAYLAKAHFHAPFDATPQAVIPDL